MLVSLGRLNVDDVAVQVLHGAVGAGDELQSPTIVDLAAEEGSGDGSAWYSGSIEPKVVGRHGFAVRVVPVHPGLASPVELGRVVWA